MQERMARLSSGVAVLKVTLSSLKFIISVSFSFFPLFFLTVVASVNPVTGTVQSQAFAESSVGSGYIILIPRV